MAQYNIVSIDNSRVGLGGARVDRGDFPSGEAALVAAKQLVDDALKLLAGASSAHELMALYMRSGSEVPMIYGEPRVDFHAYRYAREKSNVMFPSGGEA